MRIICHEEQIFRHVADVRSTCVQMHQGHIAAEASRSMLHPSQASRCWSCRREEPPRRTPWSVRMVLVDHLGTVAICRPRRIAVNISSQGKNTSIVPSNIQRRTCHHWPKLSRHSLLCSTGNRQESSHKQKSFQNRTSRQQRDTTFSNHSLAEMADSNGAPCTDDITARLIIATSCRPIQR